MRAMSADESTLSCSAQLGRHPSQLIRFVRESHLVPDTRPRQRGIEERSRVVLGPPTHHPHSKVQRLE